MKGKKWTDDYWGINAKPMKDDGDILEEHVEESYEDASGMVKRQNAQLKKKIQKVKKCGCKKKGKGKGKYGHSAYNVGYGGY